MLASPNRVKDLFLAAADLSPTERPGFLAGACGSDCNLRAAVDRLLAAHDHPDSLLAPSAALPNIPPPPERGSAGSALAAPGTVVGGRYKLIEVIGEGGMGEVWMAQQTEPVRRAVAIKLIKPGMDSKAVLARFEAERQALALMDHPNIAKVLDAGTSADGRPFFVMDLVRGVPITTFCDERKLPTRDRLRLFVQVCQAIQHAHQKGIIHRDIKPTNVLVALYDDHPVPKVIDFGVAKAAGTPLTERTLMTGFGVIVGTPEYMAPEQATLNQLDVDTRADVYALGVLFYELLTGGPPFDREKLEQTGLLEVLRVIREVDPPRPSTRLSTAATLATIAANRGTEPRKLTGLVRGELDWIAMRALEKDRVRRYETASGLAEDVERYLAGEPVRAVPPSVGYRVRKFVRRNRGPVLTTGLVFLALIGGVAGTTAGMVWAVGERQDAVKAKADSDRLRAESEARRYVALVQADSAHRARLAMAASLAETKKANERVHNEMQSVSALAYFLQQDIFEGGQKVSDGKPLGDHRDMTIHEALDRAAARVAQREDQWTFRTRVRIRWAIGDAYKSFGEYAKAIEQYEHARNVLEEDPEHIEIHFGLHKLAEAYLLTRNPAKAVEASREALRWLTIRPRPASDIQGPFIVRLDLGRAYLAAGQPADAAAVLEEAVAWASQNDPSDRNAIQFTSALLSVAYLKAGRYDHVLPTIPLARLAVALARVKYGSPDPRTAQSLGSLGYALLESGAWASAEPVLRECLETREKAAPGDWSTFNARSMLGAALLGQKRYSQAEPLLLTGYRGLKDREAKIPAVARAARLVEAADRLCQFYTATGNATEAEKYRAERAGYPAERAPWPRAVK